MRTGSLALLTLFAVLVSGTMRAATLTEVKYRLDGKSVARVLYSGGDRWKPLKSWKLLAREPIVIAEMKIVPDESGGVTATLKGKLIVSIMIRNSRIIGVVETDRLTFVRRNADSDGWHLPKEEAKRLEKLASEKKEE